MYFYDERGDDLFQQIMQLEEYYLTNSELEIFKKYRQDILDIIGTSKFFRIVELGAGDGSKTRVLLDHFLAERAQFAYSPVDISPNVLEILENNLQSALPDLKVDSLAGDYFKVLKDLQFKEGEKKIVFFLGSNIGNYLDERTINFLTSVRENLHIGDQMLIGVDLKKDPKTILKAYNDSQGITREFNLNLLRRINSELGASFDLSLFRHNPVYDPMTGECRSYLVSLEDQIVEIDGLGQAFSFKKWETIFMEVSKKYSKDELRDLAEATGFKVIKNFDDSRSYFTDSFWEAV